MSAVSILNPLVSVIIPSYNSASVLSRAMDSVLTQSYPHLELVVCDDASVDGTAAIAGRYAMNDERVRLIASSKNGGAGVARNKAIAVARGRYIAFLDADDEWEPQKVERQLSFLQANTEYAACCSAYRISVSNEKKAKQRIMCPPVRISACMLHYHNFIGCLTAIYDTERTGGKVFMPEIRQRQDWALWLRLARRFGPIGGIQDPLGTLHRENVSMTSNKIETTRYTMAMLKEELSMGRSQALCNALIHNGIAVFRAFRSRWRKAAG